MKIASKKKSTFAPAAALLAVLALAPALHAFSQDAEIKPVTVGQPMPDFALPVYQGGELKLSALKGKNVMIIFPRGYAAPNAWCTICNYRYAELLDLEASTKLRDKHNLEILIVLPYDKDTVKAWLDVLPKQLDKIKNTKYPADPAKLDEKQKTSMERYKKLFPKDLKLKAGENTAPFPILADAERKVSKGLGLFQTEWGGSKVDQNIPAVYIVDKNGTLRFKYLSQSTVDRPEYDYLLSILNWLTAGN